jgi:hypothetical protein
MLNRQSGLSRDRADTAVVAASFDDVVGGFAAFRAAATSSAVAER